jgi:hypothetical protein
MLLVMFVPRFVFSNSVAEAFKISNDVEIDGGRDPG